MVNIQDHINIVFGTSFNSQNHFKNKQQNAIDRFVFCGIEKVSKISLAFLRLYPQINTTSELEFSLGILARSVLMDMILVMGIKKIIYKLNDNNISEIKEEVKDYCYKIISDGTNYIIDEVFDNENISEEEKSEKAGIFVSIFPNIFDTSNARPKRKSEFRYTIAGIYKNNHNPDLSSSKVVYNLYNYYSKYDHLSHWTSLSQKIPFDKRKGKLDLAITLIVIHLRDLLAIGYDMSEEYKILGTYIDELQNYLDTNYNQSDLNT